MSIAQRMRKFALSPQHDLVSDDDVQQALRTCDHEELLDTTRYERIVGDHTSFRGVQGAYGFQLAGVGVDNPMIYFAEVHLFKEIETNKELCAVISYQLDEDGKIKSNTADVVIVNGNRFVGTQYVGNNKQLRRDDGHVIVFSFTTFDSACKAADDAISKYKQQFQKDREAKDHV